jgi:hypothetical protein
MSIGANPPVTGRRDGNAGSHEQPRIPGPRGPHGGPCIQRPVLRHSRNHHPGPVPGAALRRFREHKAGSSPRRLVLRLWIGSVLASSAAVAILIVTVGGEIEALLSLNAERPYGDPHAAIAAAVLLTAAAAIGPALAFARLMVTLYPRRGDSGSPSPPDDLHRDERLPLAEPQTGKMDTEA